MAVTVGRGDFGNSTDAAQQQLARRVLKVGGKRHMPWRADGDGVQGAHPSDASTTTTAGSASHTSRCSALDKDRCSLRQQVAQAALLPVRFPHEENAFTYVTMASRLFSTRMAASTTDCQPATRFRCFRAETSYDWSCASNLAQRLGNHFKAQKPAYILAISYLERLSSQGSGQNPTPPLNLYTFVRCATLSYFSILLPFATIHVFPILMQLSSFRIVAVLLMVATKFSDDIYNTNSYYSESLGLDVSVFNQMERETLRLLNFDASISVPVYRRIDDEFEISRYRVCAHAGRPVLCGDYTLPISPEILLYANTYGFEKTLQNCGDFLTMDLQDSLIARRAGNCKYQSEAERLLAASLLQKTEHIARLMQSAHNEYFKRPRASVTRKSAP